MKLFDIYRTEMKAKDRDFRVLKKDSIQIKKDIDIKTGEVKLIEENAAIHEAQIEKRKEDLQ